MERVWQRIDDWLTLHAPELGELLQPGATEQELQDAETLMNIAFPEDIKASYRIHNGVRYSSLSSDFIAGKFALFSLKEMLENWEWWHQPHMYITDYSEGDSEDDWRKDIQRQEDSLSIEGFDAKLVPLMTWRVGVVLCFDAAHTLYESFGQIIEFAYDSGLCFVAPDIHTFLSSFADDLEAGKYIIERQAGFTILHKPPLPTEDQIHN